MSKKNVFGNEVSVDEEALENEKEPEVDEDGFEVVDETPELRATVQMEVQAKVDANHPDGMVDTSQERIHGVTLKQEECIRAREDELARISARAAFGTQEGREERTRRAAARGSAARQMDFKRRRASVDPLADPDRPDPREELSQDELAFVNRQARRLAKQLGGWTRAAISRRVAEELVRGTSRMAAVIRVFEELQMGSGRIVPIEKLEDVDRREVAVEGRIETLWEPSNRKIAQVGLISDDSGTTRVTVWKASKQPWMREGERVRIYGAARNWYEGRVSLALTGWSTVHFPERGRWWE
ncbi:SOSS complex subunit B family protein [Halopenitus salinus]|uniref:SOSS complex subunit B family protein n=1 Tax=Halopenitus salinus TaxID=1198295 RepID=A0ABD5URN1_9EURY